MTAYKSQICFQVVTFNTEPSVAKMGRLSSPNQKEQMHYSGFGLPTLFTVIQIS